MSCISSSSALTAAASPSSAASAASSSARSRSAPPAAIVLMHGGTLDWDPYLVEVMEGDSKLLSVPHSLLAANTQLLQPMLTCFKQPEQMDAAQPPRFIIGEFSLVLLHILIALHEQALQHSQMSLEVILLSRAALRNAAASAKSAPTAPQQLRSGGSASPLLFPACNSAPLRLRWSDNWRDAARSAVRCIYLPSLTWLSEEAGHLQRARRITALLSPLGAHLWPPMSWDQLLEHKDMVYSRFNRYMLPTVWIPLAAATIRSDLQRLAAALLNGTRREGGNGTYVVKGSFSFGALCVKRIEVRSFQCAELVDVLRDFVEQQHQHCVGIQPFVAGFEHEELRTWLVPDAHTKRWRASLTIRTNIDQSSNVVTAQLFQPLHGAGLRVAQLVDDMLQEQAEFFEQVRLLGVPALRIDCGYCEQRRQAFFSEFSSAGDAQMWSETHGQDLAYVVGRGMGKRLFPLLHAAPAQWTSE